MPPGLPSLLLLLAVMARIVINDIAADTAAGRGGGAVYANNSPSVVASPTGSVPATATVAPIVRGSKRQRGKKSSPLKAAAATTKDTRLFVGRFNLWSTPLD